MTTFRHTGNGVEMPLPGGTVIAVAGGTVDVDDPADIEALKVHPEWVEQKPARKKATTPKEDLT